MNQLSISFETASPINSVNLSRQNKVIFEHLSKGHKITTVSARGRFQIFNLHSRISDLRNKAGIVIYDRMVSISGTNCKEYSLHPFT